jgi:hypothetical protein
MPLLDAIVEDGKLVLPAPLPYANGTKVSVQVEPIVPVVPTVNGIPNPPAEEEEEEDALLWLARNAIDTGITDGADEHDHYIYGSPKRSQRKPKNAAGPD